jgi:DNA-binding CsgD family transcriptional regulator
MKLLDPRNAILAAQGAAGGARKTLKHIREVADPRTIAAGFVGLTAGEIVGGAVGGVVGVVVAGPAGAAVGAPIGAFTAGMVGLKLGTETMDYRLQAKRGDLRTDKERPHQVEVGKFLRTKSGERVGEFAGLTSGAAVGLVVAGPVGGLVGAVIGEAIGGQLGEDIARRKSALPGDASSSQSPAAITRWIENLGKTTAGEGAVVLAGGTVGSLFGPSGRAVGQRLGIIVGKRVRWQDIATSDGGADDEGQTPASLVVRELPDTGSGTTKRNELAANTQLTTREFEVLTLYSVGLTEEQIAVQLSVRPATVERHLRRICQKLGVEDAQEAADRSVIFVPVPDSESGATSVGIGTEIET